MAKKPNTTTTAEKTAGKVSPITRVNKDNAMQLVKAAHDEAYAALKREDVSDKTTARLVLLLSTAMLSGVPEIDMDDFSADDIVNSAMIAEAEGRTPVYMAE